MARPAPTVGGEQHLEHGGGLVGEAPLRLDEAGLAHVGRGRPRQAGLEDRAEGGQHLPEGVVADAAIRRRQPAHEVERLQGHIAPEVLGKLRAELKKVLESPDVKQKMNAAGGLDPYLTTPEEFSALIRRDYEKYAKVVKDIGIKLD
jgi:hypothetical protein